MNKIILKFSLEESPSFLDSQWKNLNLYRNEQIHFLKFWLENFYLFQKNLIHFWKISLEKYPLSP